MEVFMRNIAFSVTQDQLKIELARIFHSLDYRHHVDTALPINIEVRIFPRKGRAPARCGAFTVPTAAIGQQFIHEYGGLMPQRTVVIGTRIIFQISRREARPHIVEELRRLPYEDPRERIEREERSSEVSSLSIPLQALQFGWECRDNVYSIEWEKLFVDAGTSCKLTFDDERREFRIAYSHPDDKDTRIVAIRASQISWCSANRLLSTGILFLSLNHPPAFESQTKVPSPGQTLTGALEALLEHLALSLTTEPPPRQRWPALDNFHADVASYISLAIRLECRDASHVSVFKKQCAAASIQAGDYLYPVERRNLFSYNVRKAYKAWVTTLIWPVAFQIEALTHAMVVDLREMLQLRSEIDKLLHERGNSFAVMFLRHFATQAKAMFWYTEDLQSPTGSVQELFAHCRSEYTPPKFRGRKWIADPQDTFECLHVTFTPSTYRLDGPYPERSNRVIRQYPGHHDSFLRVSFVDETDLQYRFDRDVDGRAFIKRRVGRLLTDGLEIAGRSFEFLAYSQSALKEHAVWFVKEFVTDDGTTINARNIIAGLGKFHGLLSDPNLIYCPARYGARLSQAFTATDSSVTVEAEEIFMIDDIKDASNKWTFTDGVGTISRQLAREIWKSLSARRRGSRKAQTYPRALQVRFLGSKGMLNVDYTLSGRAICLRPSMIKFEVPDSSSNQIEIARAFHKPGPFYLNRPFIMVLEDLGVPYEVFAKLQQDAVNNAQRAVESLERSGRLFEGYGLGASYRLTSVMLSLHKLGVAPPSTDTFWRRSIDFAINHVLRELKHHARIPVPDAWNLVGVADVHEYLNEGEIFACIVPQDGTGPIYLEGPTLVSRSPTIHPGDVQVVHGIGRPPLGSPFEQESLQNTLVFSVKGTRPLPSYLGGGDLDGDEYRVTMLESLRPPRTHPPADYDPAKRKLIDHPSTMQDVADFVTEYITSDSLGIIASTWLIIADQSTLGCLDPDCMKLSALHSDAVDYPKSGQPVALERLPRLKFRLKPDWNAPETAQLDPRRFYESQKAIGKLFRAIDLPAVQSVRGVQHAQRRAIGKGQSSELTVEEIILDFNEGEVEEHPFYDVVLDHISGFIRPGRHEDALIAEMWELLGNYKSQLQTICADHTLSNQRNAMLSEEEAVVGTIVAKCSQARKRKDLMSKMREKTAALVDNVIAEIDGDAGTLSEKLERGWVSFRLAILEGETFGARSFAWVAMSVMFDTVKEIEQSEGLY